MENSSLFMENDALEKLTELYNILTNTLEKRKKSFS
jgi:hypothetical protein